ncbi:protein of unknown function [Acidithiobacillus ferrivorans]|uniref:Transposase IS4-like domain-containing protein n=1 Tax=Acidithiobacillus ferrivorans TaxID=160808 RepID=A0A060UWH1_9PROT|nr:hypothetical protein AFERRI_420187 [Acidithiobacillus ferrivorans]SMH66027.1 protein of unknown function [Acidithiobacillus ferrivorans]
MTDLAESFRDLAQTFSVMLYGKQRDVLAYDQVFMLKNLRCPVRVVWVFRKTQWVAFFTTDLTLSVTQIIEYYGARWKIEAGYKEIKQMEWMPPLPTGPAAGRFGRESPLDPDGIRVPRWKFIHGKDKEDSSCRLQLMDWIWQKWSCSCTG